MIERIPTIEEYRELRRLSGLSGKSEEAATRGLPNTIHAVVIEHDGQTIGMGRVIGDGGTAYQVTDIAVLEAHRGKIAEHPPTERDDGGGDGLRARPRRLRARSRAALARAARGDWRNERSRAMRRGPSGRSRVPPLLRRLR